MLRAARRHASSLLALVLIVAGVAPFAARAQNLDASYRVQDIAVEAAAGDAVQAQAVAIEQGQRQGLRRLLERLTGGAAPDLAGVAIDDYVASFEITSETVGPTTYAASMAVSYDRGAVQDLLDRRGVAYVDAAAAPTTLVPLWETGAGLRLWDGDNAWKAAWDRALAEDALAPLVVPLGDLQDLALLDADQAARAEPAALAALAERYGTEEVVVARLIGAGEPGAPLEVRARRYGGEADGAYRATVRREPGEPLATSLERAVDEMQASFDQRVRQRSAARPAGVSTLAVTASIDGLDGWGRLLGYLDDLAEVEAATVRRFSREEARLNLQIRGDVERLQAALGEGGWFLDEDDAAGWRLRRGGAPNGTSTL